MQDTGIKNKTALQTIVHIQTHIVYKLQKIDKTSIMLKLFSYNHYVIPQENKLRRKRKYPFLELNCRSKILTV